MKFRVTLCFMLMTTFLIGQNLENNKKPNFRWSFANKKINNEYIEFNIKTIITEGWMIITETDTSFFSQPLQIQLNKKDSLLMKRIEIKQIKGEKLYNKKLEENIGSKIETTIGEVEYQVRIYLKSKVKLVKLSGVITYWTLCEDATFPPSDQEFILKF